MISDPGGQDCMVPGLWQLPQNNLESGTEDETRPSDDPSENMHGVHYNHAYVQYNQMPNKFVSEEEYSPIALRLEPEDVYDKIEFASEDNLSDIHQNQQSFNNIETILEHEEILKESHSFDNPGFDINGEIEDHCFPKRKQRNVAKERNLYENSFQVNNFHKVT